MSHPDARPARYVGSRPQTIRETASTPTHTATDQAIADTSGVPKSVPERSEWKEGAPKAR